MQNIKLEGSKNIRDLGNIELLNNRIKSKMLLRGGSLDLLSDNDISNLVNEYQLKTIIDLRTEKEIEERPDVKIENVDYLKMPVFNNSILGITQEKTNIIDPLKINMKELYSKMIEECLENISKIIHYIVNADIDKYSILFHCKEGKDRTGVISAILLLILGVDKDKIIEDYLFTNTINKVKADIYYNKAIQMNMNQNQAESVKNIFLAKGEYIEEIFKAIENKWDGQDNFIKIHLKLEHEQVQSFRDKIIK